MNLIKPAKVISVYVSSLTPVDIMSITTETDLIEVPYTWEASVVLNFATQTGNPSKSSFTLLDVVPGDWLASGSGGRAVKVVEIVSADTDVLTCKVEDVDRFNAFNNGSGQTNGAIEAGDTLGYIFELSEDGLPILTSTDFNSVPPAFATDLISRFTFRNKLKSKLTFTQAGHDFVVGDLLYVDETDGAFKKAVANSPKIKNLVGAVSEINIPSDGDFTLRPLGQVVNDINPALPGTKGKLIYIHPSIPGTLTSVRPDRWANPVYLQLNDSGTMGLMFNQGVDIVGPSGRGTSVQVVADITARDALTVADGDQVYVIDAGEGEWSLFLYKDVGGWTEVSNQDSSTVDARTVSVMLDFSQVGSLDICRVSPNARVTQVTVEVLSAFSTNATLTIGDDTINNRLMDEAEIDLGNVETFNSNTIYQYGGTTETMLKAYFTPNGSASGQAKITVSYS